MALFGKKKDTSNSTTSIEINANTSGIGYGTIDLDTQASTDAISINSSVVSAVESFLNKNLNVPKEEKEPEPETKEEEWIWVEGYKGTDKDMRCRGYQYELGKRFDMAEDVEIEECTSGFHLCRDLKDVFSYYEVIDGNRYFKVKALVRKADFELYGKRHNGYVFLSRRIDKLVAKSIEFVSELTVDEICEAAFDKDVLKHFTKNDKKKVIELGKNEVLTDIACRKLVKLGYSKMFAHYIVKHNKFETAYAVGTQEDLSMDMKCLLIFNK